jgi:hypothetical protein
MDTLYALDTSLIVEQRTMTDFWKGRFLYVCVFGSFTLTSGMNHMSEQGFCN